MLDLNNTWFDFNCPKCGYIETAQLVDVKTERTVYCHNCKISIKLIDNESSSHQGIEKINKSLKDLENLFKNFGK
jgi:transcription elongation factor Elf1